MDLDAVNERAKTGDGEWGHLACDAHLAERTSAKDYEEITFENSLSIKYSHAAHCMIFARWNEPRFKLYNPRAAVLLQIRFDGFLGFPGGLVDAGEDVIAGLNRELKEEIDLDYEKHPVNLEDHIVSHINHAKEFIAHFFAIEVTLEEFKEIEKRCLNSHDYGEEVLGITRVPLYTMGDNYRGFPAFLNHNFVANSKQQFYKALEARSIFSKEELNTAIENSTKQVP